MIDINKFILLLRKRVYPYEYMGSWKRFDEKRVLKIFHNKNLGDYHDLYVQSDALLLADVFKYFRNKCIEIYELDPAHFLSVSGLA